MNPSLLETFRNTNERLIGVNQLLEYAVERLCQNHLTKIDGIVILDLTWYLPNPMNDVLLSETLKPYGVSYIQSKEIGGVMNSGAIFYTENFQLNIDRKKLLISERDIGYTPPLTISCVGTYQWRDQTIDIESDEIVSFVQNDPNSASLDLDKIAFPIVVRSWEEGDVFTPLGMSGKKKVSDFMIDNKIPLTLKKRIPLFVSGEDICWVGGHRIDDRFKISKRTMGVLKIKISCRD